MLKKALRSADQSTTPDRWRALLRTEWEHAIKRDFEFSTSADNTRKIRLSTVTDQSITLHDTQMRQVFGSVTTQILDLVQRQVEEVKKVSGGKAPKAILVVGGFGRCPFIRGALKHKSAGGGVSGGGDRHSGPKTKKARIEVTSGANTSGIPIMTDTGDMPWVAICRDAVLSKLGDNARVESRKARFNFDFPQSTIALPEEGGKWDSLFGRHMIPDTMTWVLKRVRWYSRTKCPVAVWPYGC